MKVYPTEKIRNVVLLGHGGCGKTSLAEAMAYLAGMTNRMGNVNDGNTISDYDKEEIRRSFSIHTSVIPIPWEDGKINVLDTPGFFDFVGEVEEAASAADAAVIVVSGKAGIETGTRRAWEVCEKYHLPRIFFVTDMDMEDADYRRVAEDLQNTFGSSVAPFHFPLRENGKFVGYVNVIQQTAKRWIAKGDVEKIDVPADQTDQLSEYRDALVEAVAETSEELMERYFDGEEFTDDEIREAMNENIKDASIVPVLMGSNVMARGMYTLMVDIMRYFPSPAERSTAAKNPYTDEDVASHYDPKDPTSLYVFKTIVDPFIGKYTLIKVMSGTLHADEVLYNVQRDADEKMGRLYVIRGNKVEEVPTLSAGDIGALTKLAVTQTSDTLCTRQNPLVYPAADIPKPYVSMRYRGKRKGEEDKISQALQKLQAEDLTLSVVNDSENGQTLLFGIGDQQLDIVVSILADRYRAEIELMRPKVAFRETLRKRTDVEYKYKKQSGGHGQYGHVKMIFEPSDDLDRPYIFEQCVVGGVVPRNYFPAVEKGIAEAVQSGPLAAYPVVGVKATLYDGSYHPVDSSEMAFKVAAKQAFKKGFLQASPVLLEPIVTIKVVVPDQYTGDIMGDLNKRRGRVMGMNPTGNGYQEIVADLPSLELYGYNTSLRSMTSGSGTFSYEFARYEQAPDEVAQHEIEERANALSEDEE